MNDLSVWRRIRSGEWKQVSGGGLPVVATIGIVLDVVTTAYVLISPEFGEMNAIIAGFASTSPWYGIAYFAATNLFFLGIIWLNGGWVSDAVAIFKAVINTAFGTNNLILFATGYSAYGAIGDVKGLVLAEGAAFTLIAAYVYRNRVDIPLRELIVIGGLGVLITAAVFVLET